MVKMYTLGISTMMNKVGRHCEMGTMGWHLVEKRLQFEGGLSNYGVMSLGV